MIENQLEMKVFEEFATRLADASRVILRDSMRREVSATTKDDGSPVTVIDQAVESRMREMIKETFPDHGIVGEEAGTCGSERELVWVLDPVDGTLPFLAGIPVYGTLIALLYEKAPVLGVIDMPATGERWIGCRGRRTERNGLSVRTRECANLSGALLSTSNPDFYSAADLSILRRMKKATRWTVYGGSCMAYAQIASGRIDIGIDVEFDPVDYLALVPVVEGAGGVITDWGGRPLNLESDGRFVACGDPRIHTQALKILTHSL